MKRFVLAATLVLLVFALSCAPGPNSLTDTPDADGGLAGFWKGLWHGFIVVIASMVQITEMAIKKLSPTLFRQLGIYLPLITTNCAILGLAIFQTNRGYDFLQGIVFAVGAGLGLTLALVLMASIRETSELSDIPAIAKGTGLTLIIAGSLSLAFMGFAGLFSSS